MFRDFKIINIYLKVFGSPNFLMARYRFVILQAAYGATVMNEVGDSLPFPLTLQKNS